MIKKYTSIIFLTLLAAFSLAVFTPVKKAYALDPGCYVLSSEGGGYTPADCPAGIDPKGTKCFWAPVSSQGVGNFTTLDCDTGTGTPSPSATLDPPAFNTGTPGEYQCGTGENAVMTSIDFGCKGAELEGTRDLNPVHDMIFAVLRFLSAGVGLVIIGSVIVAGIQYTTSRGNPQASGDAMKRVASSFGALIFYIFAYAIANFIVPGGLFL